jgi:CheY-like chemotaxis protein
MSAAPPKHLIVYAEDDADDRELMQEAFEKYSHCVELMMFADGASILRYLSRLSLGGQKPCLIVMDLNLPLLDGQEVVQQLRTMPVYENTPIVFFTTSSQQRDQAFARNYRTGFITKPLTYRQMDAITEQLVDACEQGIQNQIRKPAL